RGGAFWLNGQHLVTLLGSLQGPPKEAAAVWLRFGRALSKALLTGDALQQRLFGRLWAARAALAGSVPPDCDRLLQDWDLLRRAFLTPGDGTSPEPQELDAACQRLRLGRDELLGEHLARRLHDPPALAGLLDTYMMFQPTGRQLEDFRAPLEGWL